MNIALLLTGFIRQYSQCQESIVKNIIEKYNTDVYISTWDKSQSYAKSEVTGVDYYSVINQPYVKGFSVLDYDFYMKNKTFIEFQSRLDDIFTTNERAKQHGSFWVERLRDQWYGVKNGFMLIPNGIYDIIIRCRMDMKVNNFDIQYDGFTTPKSHPKNPYNDHFAYGNEYQMRKYCSLYDEIELMYIEDNLDISFAELMLKHYMENRNPRITTNIDPTITYEILK